MLVTQQDTSSKCKLVTSFSPTRLAAQHKALATWKQFNQEIVAVQVIGESYSEKFTDNIVWVKPNLHWSKKLPSIVSLLSQCKDEPIILINSDIEIDLDSLDDWKPESNVLKIGLRTDYCSRFTQLNKYGLDVFLITPEMLEHLTNNIWAIGQPGWDYWLVYKLYQEGYKLDIVNKGFLHEFHQEQWNGEDYRRCSKLLEFEFDIPVQDIADKLQELTGRTHLRKRVWEDVI